MTYQELVRHLISISDKKHAEFSGNLSNSDYITIGVKNPILRELIKTHCNDSDLLLDDFERSKYLEVDFIYFGIGLKRCKSIEEQLSFLDKNINYAKSWAVTDTINHSLRKCSFDLYWKFFLFHYKDKHVYTRRFSYVFGLMFYKNEKILQIFNYLNESDEYMVMMAEAWLLATIATTYPQQVFELLENLEDRKLKLKTISKICDSFRFSDEQKNKFKSLRAKETDIEKLAYLINSVGGGEPSPKAKRIIHRYVKGDIDLETAKAALIKNV